LSDAIFEKETSNPVTLIPAGTEDADVVGGDAFGVLLQAAVTPARESTATITPHRLMSLALRSVSMV
jgi:hypothetical protein